MEVVILGASDKPESYAFKAFNMLKDFKHTPIPVHPKHTEILNTKVYQSIADVPKGAHTLTVYVNKNILESLCSEILDYGFKRIILNPGTESETFIKQAQGAGIDVECACTLVMLQTSQF